jgi:hypothetical protein
LIFEQLECKRFSANKRHLFVFNVGFSNFADAEDDEAGLAQVCVTFSPDEMPDGI